MSNPNTNRLAGMKCPNPECEDPYGPFYISTIVSVLANDTGTEVEGGDDWDAEWEDSSAISCKACEHDGTVKDFKDPEVKK